MKKMRKRILLLLMIVVIFTVSLTDHIYVKATEVVVGGVTVTKVILELIVSTAISYELAEKISDVSVTEMLGIGFHSTHPNYILEGADIRHIDELGKSQELKMEVIYEGTKVKVKYSDGQEYDGTEVDGKQLFVNPLVVNALVESGQWQIVLQANETIKSLSITSLYSMSLALGQDITEFQNARNKAMSQCVTAVAYAMQQVREYYKPLEGLTPNDVLEIENSQRIQMLRHKNIPDTVQTQYGLKIKDVLDQNPYYIIFQDLESVVIYISQLPMSISNGMIYANTWTQYIMSSSTNIYNNYATFNNMSSTYWRTRYIPLYSNCSAIQELLDIPEFPYPLNSTDTEELVATDIPVGILPGLSGLGISIPKDGVLDKTADQIKDVFGQEVPGEYDVAFEITAPEVADPSIEFPTSVLGWLSRINTSVKDVTNIYTEVSKISDSIVIGMSTSFKAAMGDLLIGEDTEGNAVYVPQVLQNIYDNLYDTQELLGGISGVLEGIRSDVQTRAQEYDASKAEEKALANSFSSGIPQGGGGLFQLITSLVLILLLLLYLFLRCLQFIVLMFQIPASTAFLTPGMIQGLEWLKSTYLIGHKDARLTFDSVSAGNSIGFNLTIWQFMIGTVNLLILFFIIKGLRRYIERMKA